MELNLSKDTLMLDLNKVSPSLTRLRGALNWELHPMVGKIDPATGKPYEFDLDIFMFLTKDGSIQGDVKNVCFFGNKDCYNGAVVLPRDNRNGADVAGQDDEEILVTIDKIPAHINKVEHFVFLHEAVERNQDLSMISGGSFKLYDQDGKELASYKLQNFVNHTALHVGTLQRTVDGWGFQPSGESAAANPNQVLQNFA